MFCTKCGAMIADGQRFCSRCGAPVDAAAPEEAVPVYPTEPVQENPAPAPASETTVLWGAAPYAPGPTEATPPMPPEPPKKGKKVRPPKPERPRKKGAVGWIIAAVLVIAVAALVVLNLNVVKNLFDRTFSSPEAYYQHIETREISKYSDAIANRQGALAAYGNLVNPDSKKTFIEEELTLSVNQKAIGDEIMSLLEDEAGIDLSWFESVGLYASGGVRDEVMGGELIALLNGTEIVGANYAFDTENNTIYASVPELSGQYMQVSAEELMGGYSSYRARSTAETAEEVLKALPDEAKLAKIMDRYTALVVKNLTKVERGSEKVTAGEVSCTYTTLQVKIDGKIMLKIAKDVLNKLHDDRDVEDLICNYLAAMGMTDEQVDEYFFDFLDEIEGALEEIESMEPGDIPVNILMTVYVDAAGNVRGRDIKIREEKELVAQLSYLLTVSGTKFGVKASVKSLDSYGEKGDDYYWADETTVTLAGSGKFNLKKEVNGSFDLRYQMESEYNGNTDKVDMKLVKIGLTAAAKDEGASIQIDITPTKDAVEAILDELYEVPQPIEELIRSASVSLRAETGEKKFSLDYVLRNGKKDAITLSVKGNEIKSYDISIPSKPVSPDEWAYGLDMSKISNIIAHLRDAGVPASLLEEFEYMF